MTRTELKNRAKQIQEIDKQLHILFAERDKLMWEGLTMVEHNKLVDMVMADNESHYM